MHTTLRTNRVFGLIVALAATATVLSGCGGKNNIVGKWKSKKAPAGQATTTFLTLGGMMKEFKPDGIEVTTVAIGPISVSYDGTYKVTGDSLSETIKPSVVNGTSLPIENFTGEHTSKFKLDGNSLILTSSVGSVSVKTEYERVTQSN